MCICLTYGHDEFDNAVAMIAGHHPACPNFKIDKREFTDRLELVAGQIADRKLADEIPRVRAMLVETLGPKKSKKNPELTENKIQVALFHYLNAKGHKLIAPNVDIFYTGEMDVCSMMKSGLVNEYEIKLSRADFKKDFKKEHKHPVFEKIMAGTIFEIRQGYSGKLEWRVDFTSPNFYYFVAPQDLIKIEELPGYAGLIYFDPKNICSYSFEIVKKAKQLHKTVISQEHKFAIAHKLMWRCWTAKDKIERVLAQKEFENDEH